RRIAEHPHERSEDGDFSWEEVECLGCCANAPVVQIWKDTYEDLTPESLDKILAAFARGSAPKTGSQIGRKSSLPEGAQSALLDPALYDGSKLGAWRARFPELQEGGAAPAPAVEKPKG
ncbi:MAG: NAD(P)H-dependent oxidoreductase subunit E, partial [Geminicoccaceae bacterium]